MGGSQIGMQQGYSEARTHSPIQAKPEDSQPPENELQKLGNGVSMQPPHPGICPSFSQPRDGWGSAGDPELGVSSSQSCVLCSCKEK